MYNKNLEEFLAEKEKNLTYLTHFISPMPFEQPSLNIKILLEYFFQPDDMMKLCNEMFPVNLFGNNFPISFTIEELHGSNSKINKELTIEIGHYLSYDETMKNTLLIILERLFKQIHLTKRLKNSFMFTTLSNSY